MTKTIVVVDDFKNTRKVIQFSLKTIDAEILQAENGKEALRFFDGRKIDLLITDLNMPEMDGIELVSQVRSNISYMFIPIIMLTTERNQEKKDLAANVKVTTWMQKPFEQVKFLKVINRCLKI